MDIYQQLPKYIQEYVYEQQWTNFREIQKQAFDKIISRSTNVILSAGTASGKTEAAFLPALTSIDNECINSVAILYISPLKALINDQFERLEEILKAGNIKLHKWHGDVSSSKKRELLKNPTGVLQITVESLQMMILHRAEECKILFSQLRYIVIDEMHYFMDSSRGIQLQCVLENIQRIIGVIPIRIGLSATLGNTDSAEIWLSSGTNLPCITINDSATKRKLGIILKYIFPDERESEYEKKWEEAYKFVYDVSLNKKSIIFCNSRGDAENMVVVLKEYAKKNRTKDIYRIHHGNIATSIRENVESEMKNVDENFVIAATVTLELGIDIGKLDRVVQMGTPYSVSSFAQRIGRCGRRGQRAEIVYLQQEQPDKMLNKNVDWKLLSGIAMLELFLCEQWIEPISIAQKPFAILYHQTMCCLYSNGCMKANKLAENIMSLSAFKDISIDEYKLLLKHLIKIKHIEKTGDGQLRLGEIGERLVNNYEFCGVFHTEQEYTVCSYDHMIGTVNVCPKIGSKFILAGRVWSCIEINYKAKKIMVKEDKVSFDTKWFTISNAIIDDRIVQKMKQILLDTKEYVYLDESAKKKLYDMRKWALQEKIADNIVIEKNSSYQYIFPWVGTVRMTKMQYALEKLGYDVDNRDYYLIVHATGKVSDLLADISFSMSDALNRDDLVYPKNMQVLYKYNSFIPGELLKEQYLVDYLKI